jgi:branched-chain amino acid transport system ATP-binding protein
MGFVPQGRMIFPALNVHENLRTGFIENGVDREETVIKDTLARFPRLERLLDRLGGTLSGGEQQILAMARALCGPPKLLVLDEPTDGIQPSIVEEMLEILIELHRYQGLAMILVEQSLEFIRAVAQRVLLMEKGVIPRFTALD